MKLHEKSLFLILIMFFSGNIYAGAASGKLSVLADSLIKSYAAKTVVSKTSLAVFPLNCDEKLEKQRVGFAASEVMSHRFVADGAFTVVERGEIGKLLSEQKLQASGAVDSDTAVRLGKVLGAGVILLGNIQKVDGRYQVNARLVNAETSEVLVSGYTELDASAFEDDARVYLNLVPQEQTLGIYAVFNYRQNSNKNPSFVDTGSTDQTGITPRSFYAALVGGGLLYRPSRHMQINAEIITSKLTKDKYASFVTSYNNGGITWAPQTSLEMTTISLMGGYVSELFGKCGYSVGAGLNYINTGVFMKKKEPPMGIFLKSGIEFKPQSRIGFGLSVRYELRKTVIRAKRSNYKIIELNPLSFETVMALYF